VTRLDVLSSLKFRFTRENHISAKGIVKIVERNLEKDRQGRKHGTSWVFSQIFPTLPGQIKFFIIFKMQLLMKAL
jgi:hypothetical protein